MGLAGWGQGPSDPAPTGPAPSAPRAGVDGGIPVFLPGHFSQEMARGRWGIID